MSLFLLTGQSFEHRRQWRNNAVPSILILEYTSRGVCEAWLLAGYVGLNGFMWGPVTLWIFLCFN